VLVIVGHTSTFVIAVRTAGSTAPLGDLVALLMLVQTAMLIPLSVGGWGPREGAAAWAFSAAGFGAGMGVSATTLYAVIALIAVSPGAVLLLYEATLGGRGERIRYTSRGRYTPPGPRPERFHGARRGAARWREYR